MPLISADGRTFHVQRLGSGPPVALVHGLGIGNLATWYFGVAPQLARRRSVLLYDQRGHGLSAPAESGFDLATSSADLGGILAAVAGFEGPVDLVGHSYGGPLVLRFALDQPGRVRRVVVLDAPLPPFDPAEAAELGEMAVGWMTKSRPSAAPQSEAETKAQIEKVMGLDREGFAALASRVLGERGGRVGARRADRARRLRNDTTLVDDLLAESPFDAAELARITQPVLCVYGSASPFRARADELAAALPDVRVVELDGGHLLPLTSPAAVVGAIEEFLDA